MERPALARRCLLPSTGRRSTGGLGCLLYELVSGTSPFRTQKRKLYQGTVAGQSSDAGEECGVPSLLLGRPEGFTSCCRRIPSNDSVRTSRRTLLFSTLLVGPTKRPGPRHDRGYAEAPPFQPGNSLNVEDPEEIGTFPDLPTLRRSRHVPDVLSYGGNEVPGVPQFGCCSTRTKYSRSRLLRSARSPAGERAPRPRVRRY